MAMKWKASPEWGPLGAGVGEWEVTSVHSTHRLLREDTVVAEVLLGYDTPRTLSLEGRESPFITMSA